MQVYLINEKIIEVTEIDKVKIFFKEEKLTLNEVLCLRTRQKFAVN